MRNASANCGSVTSPCKVKTHVRLDDLSQRTYLPMLLLSLHFTKQVYNPFGSDGLGCKVIDMLKVARFCSQYLEAAFLLWCPKMQIIVSIGC